MTREAPVTQQGAPYDTGSCTNSNELTLDLTVTHNELGSPRVKKGMKKAPHVGRYVGRFVTVYSSSNIPRFFAFLRIRFTCV